MQPFERVPYNKEVVGTLEMLLETAKAGRVDFFGFSMCEGPGAGTDGFIGSVESMMTGHYGLHNCARRVMERLNRGTGVQERNTGPANQWTYDLSIEPICHDFVAWLVIVKMIQASEGVTGPTKLCFVRQRDEDKFGFIDIARRDQFIEGVFKPACKLFDVEIDNSIMDRGRRHADYTYRRIVGMAANGGNEVPRVKVPEEMLSQMSGFLNGQKPVVITLREHEHWPHRNSDIAEWVRFAKWLEERGEYVIFLRDTSHADDEIEGFDTMPGASKDLMARVALYESAKCNMFVSNGSSTFGLFGSAPWLMFVRCEHSDPYRQNRPDWWVHEHGINKGEQFPWSGPQQRMVWDADTFEAMTAAWERYFGEGVEQREAAE